VLVDGCPHCNRINSVAKGESLSYECPGCGERIAVEGRSSASEASGNVKGSALVVLAGGASATVASFIPWISIRSGFGSVSAQWLEGGDGIITLILGIAMVLLGMGRIGGWSLPPVRGNPGWLQIEASERSALSRG
jgi:DNA-directed RNA polymerase subunit RPC12/RpoP